MSPCCPTLPCCSYNQFTGLLPPAWGDKTALPNLAWLQLEGNLLRGPIPDPAWTSVGESKLGWLQLANLSLACNTRLGSSKAAAPLMVTLPQTFGPRL